ncbi:MAG: transporter [Deltaproteobacteria bacterium]|jgi:hypothetical protein|nr:transporter [Deltaproteobacteria bacterium]
MKQISFTALVTLLLLFVTAQAGFADDAAAPASSRARVIASTPPVNVNIASAGTLPQGTLFTALNASFSEKDRGKDGGGSRPDVFSQVWLLKTRYGLTNHLELATVFSYANMRMRPQGAPHNHVEGYGDQALGLSYAPFNIHQGDPLALSFGLSALLPTAPQGANHAPGNSAWGGRAHAALGLWLTEDLKFDTEFVLNTPFERGNQKVKRGTQYMWNAQMRYSFDYFDLGLESSLVKMESGDRDVPGGSNINLHNGYTEWYVGPSLNIALEPSRAWLGVGVFFPLYQDVKGPAKVDDARFEFKIGMLW